MIIIGVVCLVVGFAGGIAVAYRLTGRTNYKNFWAWLKGQLKTEAGKAIDKI
jgi:hypothetical protein